MTTFGKTHAGQENEAALNWHEAQAKWHATREGKWHKLQARWHRKAIRRIPGVLGIIIGRTVRKRLPELQANLMATNALFRLLNDRKAAQSKVVAG